MFMQLKSLNMTEIASKHAYTYVNSFAKTRQLQKNQLIASTPLPNVNRSAFAEACF